MTTPDQLVMYHHSTAGFSVPAPRDWLLREDPQARVAVVIVAPESGNDFRPNMVVTVDDLEPGQTLHTWQDFVESVNPEMLDRYLLIDTEVRALRGHNVFRRLAHHANPDGVSLTMDQWSTIRGNVGYTLTATAETMEFQQTAGMFAAIAGGFRMDGDPQEGAQ